MCVCVSLSHSLTQLSHGRWSPAATAIWRRRLCTRRSLISENWQRKSVGKFVTNTEARLPRVVLVALDVFTATAGAAIAAAADVVSCCWIKIAQP